MLQNGKVQYVGIQASEKVSYNVTVTATGTFGARLRFRGQTMPWCIWRRRCRKWARWRRRCTC